MWKKKELESIQYDHVELRKVLGPLDLVFIGVGSVVGAGIFTILAPSILGEANAGATVVDYLFPAKDIVGRPGAGPAVLCSLLLVSVVCIICAFCYSELAALIPAAGSTYTFAYVAFGRLPAFLMGWTLVLEYAMATIAIGVGFSSYAMNLLDWVGLALPPAWASPTYLPDGMSDIHGAVLFNPGFHVGFNVPAFVAVLFLTYLASLGIHHSTGGNNLLVATKLAAIGSFCVGGFLLAGGFSTVTEWAPHFTPFFPNGLRGVWAGGAVIFFAFIGFDTVSTAAAESRNPQRDIPIGVVGTVLISMALYLCVAFVLLVLTPWQAVDPFAPVVVALETHGFSFLRGAVLAGALLGMGSAILVGQIGQARIWYAMGVDGLLPAIFARVDPVTHVPRISTYIAGVVVAVPAGIFDLGTLADLSNIGTFTAFFFVALAIPVLRKRYPAVPRPFSVPFGPYVLPALSMFVTLFMMAGLTLLCWFRFIIWNILGLLFYFVFANY